MGDDVDGVERVFDRFGDAIVWFFVGELCGKCAENAVPDNEDHAHIFIEIWYVAGVVYAVVRGRDEEILYPGRHAPDILGVDEYAVNLCDGVHENGIYRTEAQQYKRDEIEVLVERHEYGRPETCGQIVFLRGMVRDVDCPEEADIVVDKMLEPEHEVFGKEEGYPVGNGMPVDRQVVVVKEGKDTQANDEPEQHIYTRICQVEVDIHEGFADGVEPVPAKVAHQNFGRDEYGVDRDGKKQDDLLVKLFHLAADLKWRQAFGGLPPVTSML